MNGRKQEILLTDYADEHRFSFITVNGHRPPIIGHQPSANGQQPSLNSSLFEEKFLCVIFAIQLPSPCLFIPLYEVASVYK